MNAITRKLLCGAVLAALPIGSALACTTGAWDNGVGSGFAGGETSATADGPVNGAIGGFARYSGSCALKADAPGSSFVLDNTPAAEGADGSGGGQPYRARFYVYTGSPSGATKIFSATDADDGAGAEVFSVTYDPSGPSFDFAPAGSVPVQAGRWYSIEAFYQVGTGIEFTVQGAAASTPTVVDGGAPTNTVGSIRLGVLDAVSDADTMSFDEFESTRSETTAIGRLCRGDATNDGLINVGDASAAIAERIGQTVAAGQPDADENGIVNVGDASTIIALRIANVTCS